MLPTLFIGAGIFVGAILVLVIVVASRPSAFRIVRTADMAAPPATVFAQVNDFHSWEAWSPWEKLDPTMKKVHEGAPSGKGAIYSWEGNGKVGQGRMTLMESKPPERIRIRLEFLKPFKATNTAEFTFDAEGGGTRVTWAMTGEMNFMSKLFDLIMNMDKMVGRDFEKGLTAMKAVVEAKS